MFVDREEFLSKMDERNDFARADENVNPLEGHLRYEKIKGLGNGAQGFVLLANDKQTGETVAIKFLPRGFTQIEKVKRELLNHRRFWNAHIIQFYEVFLTNRYVCIVMEYAPGGNLADYLVQNALTEDGARFFFQQLVFAVKYCHYMGVANRDIKLENTLLDADQKLLKLCDFGLSKDETSVCKTRVGTPNYLAPEIIEMPKGGTYSGKLSDVWCCGVMLYVMLYRCFPFERKEDGGLSRKEAIVRLMERIVRGEWKIPDGADTSPECVDLLKSILEVDPNKRITIDGIQQHVWYRTGLPDGVDNREYPDRPSEGLQTVNSITAIIDQAKIIEEVTREMEMG